VSTTPPVAIMATTQIAYTLSENKEKILPAGELYSPKVYRQNIYNPSN
jgi:hypothetical protein